MGCCGSLIIHSMIHVSKEFMLQQHWDQVHKSGQRISRVQLAVGSQPLNHPSGVAQWCWQPGYFYYQPILNPMSYWKTNQFCPGREDMVFCGYSCFYNEIGEKNKILEKNMLGKTRITVYSVCFPMAMIFPLLCIIYYSFLVYLSNCTIVTIPSPHTHLGVLLT